MQDTPSPHFINLDEDPFRSKRFLYIMEEGGESTTVHAANVDCIPTRWPESPRIVVGSENTFGRGGKIRPMNMTVVADHAKVGPLPQM